MCSKFTCDGESQDKGSWLPVSRLVQEWRGLGENSVSFCLKHQEVGRRGPGVAGGSCRLQESICAAVLSLLKASSVQTDQEQWQNLYNGADRLSPP